MTFAGYLSITPHSNQLNYGMCVRVCVLCGRDFIRIWFMVRENKTRGVCLQSENCTRRWRQRGSPCRFSDVSAVGQPSPHAAPFTFDPFERSRGNARRSDKCVDVSRRLICRYQSSQLPKGSPDRASISIPHKPNHGLGGPPLMSSHSSCCTRYQRSDLLPLHAIQRFTLLEYFHSGHFPLWKC